MIIYVDGKQVEMDVEIYIPPFMKPKPKESDTVSNENTHIQMPEM